MAAFIRRFTVWSNGNPPMWMLLCGLLLIQAGFGLYPVVVKMFANQEHENANVYIFSLYRSAMAIPVLFISSFIFEGRIVLPDANMAVVFASLGFVGTFVRQYSYVTAIFTMGPDLSSVFKSLTPVVTIVMAVLLSTEKFPSLLMLHTWTRFFGIIVTVGGAIQLTLMSFGTDDTVPEDDENQGIDSTGFIAMAVNVISGALFCIIQRKYIFSKTICKWKDYPLAITGYGYMFGVGFMVLFSLRYIFKGEFDQFRLPQHSLHALLYAVFISSAMCYFLIAWTNKYLMPSLVNAFVPLQIPITVIAEYLAFGDQLTIGQYTMSIIIIIGVFIVLFSKHMEENPTRYGGRINEYWNEMRRYVRFSYTKAKQSHHHHHSKLSIL